MNPSPGRVAALAATCLLAALAPILALSAPAQAAGCQEETNMGCDDDTPPDTSLGASTPALSPSGYLRQSSVAFAFVGVPNDSSDTGQIAFECQLYNTATAPSEWQSCTSGQSWSGLTPTTATPYTFRVRAVDATDSQVICVGLLCGDPDSPDEDPTPAQVTFRVDTTAPNTFVTRTPQDVLRPDWPVVLSRSAQVSLNSNEAASFTCTVNGKSRTCGVGTNVLTRLKPGTQVFSAQAVDGAGNLDPTPASTTFFVPADLKAGQGWAEKKDNLAFDGDIVAAKRVGATMKVRGLRGVRELRLIAPSGPKLGRIEVRVGRSQWYTVNLKGKRSHQKTYLIRDQYTPAQSGSLLIRVVSLPPGGSVQLDALVARK